MSKIFASVIFICIIAFLIKTEPKNDTSIALWIPIIYLLIIGSRFVSTWLGLGPQLQTSQDYLAGSPIDRSIFLALICISFFVLYKRNFNWTKLIKKNIWVFIFLSYGFISLIWSDYPFIGFKRWIKVIGNILIGLIILTEQNVVSALKIVIKKCSYILILLSVLFIKYFPDLGRGYDRWTGVVQYRGVGYNKNALGYLVLCFGFGYAWILLNEYKKVIRSKNTIAECIIFLTLIIWLLIKADSATALGCLLIGCLSIFIFNLNLISRKMPSFLAFVIISGLSFILLEYSFDIVKLTIETLGRDVTLTDRVPLWKELLEIQNNFYIGKGFESFWVSTEVDELVGKYWWRPTQAHNGYLEILLNLGIFGLFFLFTIFWSSYEKIRKEIKRRSDYALFRIGFLVIALLYNFTEAAFKGQHIIFFFFLLVILDVESPKEINNRQKKF